MLLANFNRKEHLRHRAVSLRQHGFLVKDLFTDCCFEVHFRSFDSWHVLSTSRSVWLVWNINYRYTAHLKKLDTHNFSKSGPIFTLAVLLNIHVTLLLIICILLAGGVEVAAVQCSEDLSNSKSSLSTAEVFYCSGSRLFKSQTIYDVSHDDNTVVCYSSPGLLSSVDTHISDRPPCNDRICPYCNQLVASLVSEAEYQRHIQSHLDSEAEDDDDVINWLTAAVIQWTSWVWFKRSAVEWKAA